MYGGMFVYVYVSACNHNTFAGIQNDYLVVTSLPGYRF